MSPYLIVDRKNCDVECLVDLEVSMQIGDGIDEPHVEPVRSDVSLGRYVCDHVAIYHRLGERPKRHDRRSVLVSERGVIVVSYQPRVLRHSITDDERLTGHHEHHVLVRVLGVPVSETKTF